MNFDPRWLNLESMHNWEKYSSAIATEMRQAADEGKDVEEYCALAEAIAGLKESPVKEELADVFFKAILNAPIRADYPYTEPDSLEEIFAARPAERRVWTAPEKNDQLAAKVRGAWLGRICGCLLGKPVEGWRTPNLHKLLKASDNFPLKRYMSFADVEKAGLTSATFPEAAWIDRIDGAAPVDDDTNYTAMAACVIERRPPNPISRFAERASIP